MTTSETKWTLGEWQQAKDKLVTQPDPPNGPYVVLARFADEATIGDRELIRSAPAMAQEIAAMREALRRAISMLGRAHNADQPMTGIAMTDGRRWALVCEAAAELHDALSGGAQ
jgi:hypothetical protein